jgi:hypothetical protein
VKHSRLIETLWLSYRQRVIPKDAPKVQIDECQLAFYAGATALFSTIISILQPGQEATDADLETMSAIEAELRGFAEDIGRRIGVVS